MYPTGTVKSRLCCGRRELRCIMATGDYEGGSVWEKAMRILLLIIKFHENFLRFL